MPTLEEIIAQAQAEDAAAGQPSVIDPAPLPGLPPTPQVSPLPSIEPTAPEPVGNVGVFTDFPESPLPEEPSLLSQVGNTASAFIEGAFKQAATIGNPRTTFDDPVSDLFDISDEGQTTASQISSGLGGAATQIATVGGASVLGGLGGGALLGSSLGPAGTVVGGIIGGGAAATTLAIQNIRRSLFGVEQEVQQRAEAEGREATPEELAEARRLAAPGVITANIAEQAFLVVTGGAGSLGRAVLKEGVKTGVRGGVAATVQRGTQQFTRDQLVKRAAEGAVSRLGKIRNVLAAGTAGAVTEGASEALEGASTRAAAETVIEGGDFTDNLGEELTSAESLQDFIVGGAVGGIIGGTGPTLASRRSGAEELQAGLDLLAKTGDLTVEDQRAVTISTTLAELENPAGRNEIVVPELVATSEQLEAILSNDAGIAVAANEDGSTTLTVTDPESLGQVLDPVGEQVPILRKDENPLYNTKVLTDEDGNMTLEAVGPLQSFDDQGNVIQASRQDILQERAFLRLLDSKGVEVNFQQVGSEGFNRTAPENQQLFSPTLESTPETTSVENVTNLNPENSFGALLTTTAKKLLTPEGTNIPSAFAIQNASDATQRAILKTAEQNGRALRVGLDQAVERLNKTGVKSEARKNQIRKQLNLELNEYLIGERDKNQIARELRPAATRARGQIDKLSKQLIREGVAEGGAAQIIDENIGTYVNRNYQIFTDPDWTKNLLSTEDGQKIYAQAKGFLANQLPRKTNESRADFDTRVEATMAALLSKGNTSPSQFLSQETQVVRDLGALLERQDIPLEIRALWGEQKGGIENYITTVSNQANILADYRYASDMARVGQAEGWLSNQRDPINYPEAIRTENALEGVAVNPLEGLFGSRDVAEMLARPEQPKPEGFWKTMFQLNAFAKYSATILNPTTHARNFVANFGFLMANGNGAFLMSKQGLKDANTAARVLFREIAPQTMFDADGVSLDRKFDADTRADQDVIVQQTFTTDDGAQIEPGTEIKKGENIPAGLTVRNKDLVEGGVVGPNLQSVYERMVELGVLEDTVRAGELADVAKDLFGSEKSLADFVQGRVNLGSRTKGVLDTVGRLYQGEDGFFKIIGFMSERRKLREALGDQMTEQELDQEAANIVRNTMPTYSQVPEYIKALRNAPIGPFVSFPAEVLRNNVNIMKQIRKEIANPSTRKVGLDRGFGFMAAHSATLSAAYALKYMMGITDEEEEAIREVSAPWDRNGTLLFWGDNEDGSPRYINLSYSDPFAIFKDSFIHAPLQAAKSENSMIAAGLSEFFSPFLSEDILVQRIADVARNQTKDGREVFNPQDTESTKYLKMFTHMWEGVEPKFIGTADRLFSAAAGDKFKGRDLDFITELTAMSMGQRLTTVDLDTSAFFTTSRLSRDLRNTSRIFTSEARREDRSNQQVRNAFNRMLIQKGRSYRELSRKMNAYLYLGMEEEDLREKLKEQRTISDKDFDIVFEGGRPPRFIVDDPELKITKQKREQYEKIPGRLELVERLVDRANEEDRDF